MSGTDDRVVAMHFENADFQKNVGSTLGTLDALKKSLNFDGAAQAFANVEAASGKVSLGHMGEAVEGVSAKFIALTTVAVTALSNITNKVLNAGETFVKSFTVAPIMDGFHEMETKMGSIQTILANTARFNTGLPEVTKSLDSLNTYADKTIYSFSDMTKNIGLFTNAGIKIQDATSMIKGFSNVAAASGTSAEGAAGAAYQLSQALSAGQIRLMDWKSLTNVGMGNKNMQDGLIKIAEAMGKFNETGDDAKDVAGNFNASLESGWLSADVMSSYLKIMAGEMSDADAKSLHLSKSVVDSFKSQQQTAEDAATKVRTFTQLVGTIKESVGSGWTDTWEIVLGNFTDATKLFTDINNSVSGFVTKMSDARNKLLGDWAKMGGRDILIDALKQGLKDLGAIIKPIHDAFREIFPPTTAQSLIEMTKNFAELMQHLKIGPEAADKLKRTFAGVFALFDIIKTVLGDVIHLFIHLAGAVLPSTGEGILGVTANAGDFLVALDKMLVGGGKLGAFFDFLGHLIDIAADAIHKAAGAVGDFFIALSKTDAVKDIGKFFTEVGGDIEDFFTTVSKANILDHFKDLINGVHGALSNLFDTIGKSKGAAADGLGATESGLGRVGDRAKSLADAGGKIIDFFEYLETSVAHAVEKVIPVLGNFFSNLGGAIAGGMKSGNFDQVFDVINVGLLGGIVLMLNKFFKQGLKLDIGGGLFGQIKQTLGEVTGTLKTMQAELKAKALMEIAIAMGVLTASIVVLSLIDSKNLTKSLAAIGVGFGEMVIVMKELDKIAGSGVKGSSRLSVLVGALIALSGATIILSGALAVIGSLDIEQIGKGLLGLTGALAVLVGALKIMNESSKFTAGGSLALIGMAKALNMIAGAVKAFGDIPMGELGKGMAAVGLALGAIVLAMNALPGGALAGAGLAMAGAGMILIATALGILVGVVRLFAMMSVEDLAKGLVAMGVALGAMGLAMQLFPPWLPLVAVGMMLLVPALLALVGVIAIMGHMDIGTLVQGIASMAAVLLVLATGMILMETAIPGALATFVVAAAMEALAIVIKTLGSMSLGDIAKGIGAIAAVLLVLGIAALVMEPILPMLFALGVSLALIGAAFTLFGAGAYLVARAFEIMGKAGGDGMDAIITAIAKFLKAIPQFVGLLIQALASSAVEFIKIGDMLVLLAGKFLGDLLKLIIDNAPKIAQAILALITAGLELIRGIVGDIVETGFIVLVAFLKGLKDHIDQVTQLAIDIVARLADTMVKNEQKLVDAAINLLLGFLSAIANRANDITAAGLNVLLSFIAGMVNNLYRIIDFAVTLIITIAQTIVNENLRIINAGINILLSFLAGMVNNLYQIVNFAVTLLITFAQTIANEAGRIINAGADIIIKFAQGLGRNVQRVIDAGADILVKFMEGVGRDINKVVDQGAGIIIDFINKLADTIRRRGPQLVDAFFNLAASIVDGLSKGLEDAAKKHGGVIGKVFSGVIDKASDIFDSHSPSRVFMRMGGWLFEGLAIGASKDRKAETAVVNQAERIVAAFAETLGKAPDWADLDASPVITPVLDLSKVRAAAQGIDQMMAVSTIAPTVSFDQAQLISTTAELLAERAPQEPTPAPNELTFIQNNYSPDALSTNDIYRNTKSQIALAKEELDIS